MLSEEKQISDILRKLNNWRRSIMSNWGGEVHYNWDKVGIVAAA